MSNSLNVSEKAQQILNEVLQSLNDNEDALESHLPQDIYNLDKPALLAVLYRILAKIPD